jgi:hypothetical protein
MTATMPPRIARLPRDERGFPIPWNIVRGDDGTPFFIVNDEVKNLVALHDRLCPICGDTLGKRRWFVGGPGSAFDPHGWYLDLPGHHECVTYALGTCPYLATPKYLRHRDTIRHSEKLPALARMLVDETVSPDRPDLFVAVAAYRLEIQFRGIAPPYVRPVRPFLDYEFWRHGEQISYDAALVILRKKFGKHWDLPEKGTP